MCVNVPVTIFEYSNMIFHMNTWFFLFYLTFFCVSRLNIFEKKKKKQVKKLYFKLTHFVRRIWMLEWNERGIYFTPGTHKITFSWQALNLQNGGTIYWTIFSFIIIIFICILKKKKLNRVFHCFNTFFQVSNQYLLLKK